MELLQHLLTQTPHATSSALALSYKETKLSYLQLSQQVLHFAFILKKKGIKRGERIAIYSHKTPETVIACFAIASIGAVFITVNPLLKNKQLLHVLTDSQTRLLLTTKQRLSRLFADLPGLSELKQVIVLDDELENSIENQHCLISSWQRIHQQYALQTAINEKEPLTPPINTNDLVTIFYTSGSTGHAKGVCISHQNLLSGAKKVAEYCAINKQDKILALLALSFDYGFNQLCSAFYAGASVVLFDYLLPQDVLKVLAKQQITALAAVPSLWIQLSHLNWQQVTFPRLRYITNSGGKLPVPTIEFFKRNLPNTQIYLMYGLTEAFRSTYLPPKYIDSHPTSMGKALAGEEVFVINSAGKPCQSNEVGELVHRGSLVSLGYWNNQVATVKVFKTLNNRDFPASDYSATSNDKAVFSGDLVYFDEDGFLYFVRRNDDMIKTSGNRVSPSDIEEVCYTEPCINEVCVIGVEHPLLGQAIVLICSSLDGFELKKLQKRLQQQLPNYMQAQKIVAVDHLKKTANGKIDRPYYYQQYSQLFLSSN